MSGRIPVLDVLQAPDTVVADNLNAVKARILLMLALNSTSDVRRIREIFAQY